MNGDDNGNNNGQNPPDNPGNGGATPQGGATIPVFLAAAGGGALGAALGTALAMGMMSEG